ncbi:MAG: glycosyltransferase family 2 protein [Alphaproteobacteria bacterium]|nr:glycosyltransferase family 2 protein [Alphaproteobacteria bacterium]
MADSAPEITVVVPVRDEAENIDPLLAEIHAALATRDFEVVYVDDGSTDATPERLAEARRRHPRLRVVRHRRSAGQSAGLLTGIRAARGTWIATLDGDGQNDPADIPALLARAQEGDAPELVAGLRAKRRDTALKRISSRIANGVRARLLGDRTPDTGCGLKVFRRETFLRLPAFDHMHRFLPALVQRAGGRVENVKVNHRPRAAGRSKYGVMNRLWVGIVDLVGVMWLQRRALRPEIETPES